VTTCADRARADGLVRARLRGLPAPWPSPAPPGLARAVVERAVHHRVHALLHRSRPAASGWPAAVAEPLAALARMEALGEMLRTRELARVLRALAERGVPSLVWKGAALAHTLYAFPSLRPRDDADVLVRRADRERAQAVLRELGYARAPRVAGELVEQQAPFLRDDRLGCRHVVDLHWRVWNRPVLRDLPLEELRTRSRPLPALGPAARAPDAPDALLLACVHAFAHHAGQDRPLVWSWDGVLLARTLDPAGWDAFAGRAARRGVRGLCAAGLEDARRLGAPVPPRVLAALAAGPEEPSARLLRAGPARLLWEDWRAWPGLRRKLRFLRELALPDADYVRRRSGARTRTALAGAYLRRAAARLGGAPWPS